MNPVIVSELLRHPAGAAGRCLEQRALRALVTTCLATIVMCSAVFGATLGGQRGGLQILYSAIKVPAASLVTLILCVPAYYAFANAFCRAFSLRSVVALALASLARASLVLVAAAPVLWWVIDAGGGYHTVAVAAAVAYGLSGVAALGVMLRALGRAGWATAALFVALFGLVGGQTAWTLRPYMGRPSQGRVPFLRLPDGQFAKHLYTSGRSSVGLYEEPEALVRPDAKSVSRDQVESTPDREPVP